MINAIIYSKNRAMQLDCLLRSIEKNAPFLNPIVIYKATSEFYQQGYDKIQTRWLIKEKNLKKDTIDFMTSGIICFIMDDDIIFKYIKEIPTLKKKQTYSIRLGKNVRHRKAFSYVFSLDGNFFRKEDILPLIKKIKFTNPNILESHLQYRFHKGWKVIYDTQKLIGFTHNRVSIGSKCRYTNKYPLELLNEKFLNGDIIDFENMDFSGLNGVHTSMDYKFKNTSLMNECWKSIKYIKKMRTTKPLLRTGHGRVLKKLVEPIKDLSIIDLGCGNGNAGILFKNYTGADTELMINKIAKPTNPNFKYITFDAYSQDYAFIKDYEVVLMNAFIDVVNRPFLVLEKVLKESVKYIVLHRQEIIDGKTTITIEKSYGGADTYHSKINRQEFLDMLDKYKYKIVKEESCGFNNWNKGGSSLLIKKI